MISRDEEQAREERFGRERPMRAINLRSAGHADLMAEIVRALRAGEHARASFCARILADECDLDGVLRKWLSVADLLLAISDVEGERARRQR